MSRIICFFEVGVIFIWGEWPKNGNYRYKLLDDKDLYTAKYLTEAGDCVIVRVNTQTGLRYGKANQ